MSIVVRQSYSGLLILVGGVFLLGLGACGDDGGGDNNNNTNGNNNTGGCGNGIQEVGEQCDDGPSNSDNLADACRTDCRNAYCGDQIVDSVESCDEGSGNADAPNATCREDCVLARCGDGVVDDLAGEACDTGGDNSDTTPNACRTDCVSYRCGDGVIDDAAGEVCDDGNTTDGDGCRGDCLSDESCGNGLVDTGGNEECDDANAVDWDGCNDCSISEFGVNTYTTAGQQFCDVAVAADGSFVVVWGSFGQDGGSNGIYAQRYDGNGATQGGELHVNQVPPFSTMWTYVPRVDMADDGRFVVTWVSSEVLGDYNVMVRLFDAAGVPQSDELTVSSVSGGDIYIDPDVAMADDGSFVVVWTGPDANGTGIIGQRYDATGTPLGGLFPAQTSAWGNQEFPRVSMAGGGQFVVVFQSVDTDGTSASFQRFLSSGVADGTTTVANSTMANDQTRPSVSMADDGRFVIVWQSALQDLDSSTGIYGQRYSALGVPLGTEFAVNSYTVGVQEHPSISLAADGRFVVVWSSGAQDGSGMGIFGQRYDSAGGVQGGEFPLNQYTAGNQQGGSVTLAADGRFIVAWESTQQDGDYLGIFAQRFSDVSLPLGVP